MKTARHGLTGESLTLTDTGWHEVDSNDPSAILMQLEDEQDDEEIDLDGINAIPRDALKRLVRWLVPSQARSSAKRWRISQIRLAILSQMLDVDGTGQLTFEQLGKELGCTRALLSYYSLRMIDDLGQNKSANGKSRASREVFRQSAIASHQARGHRMKSAQEAS